MQNIGCAVPVLLTAMPLDSNRNCPFQEPASVLLHCWLISANNAVSSSSSWSMRQEKPHQTYRSDDQACNYDCFQCSEGALRFLIQWSQSRADKSSIAPVRFIDSFLHNGEQSITQAKR